MNIELKQINEADAVLLHTMQHEAFQELLQKYQDIETNPAAETLETTKMKLQQPTSTFYFAHSGNEIIGAIRIIKTSNATAKISPMFILPTYQGHGYAQQLLTTIEKTNPDINHWILRTIKQEAKLLHLYQKMGYKRTYNDTILSPIQTIISLEKQL